MFYGNSAATDLSNRVAVWDSNFKGVWHFAEAYSTAAGAYKDSTASPANGTLTDSNANSVSALGTVGNALDLNGDADYIDVGNPTKLQIMGPLTISAWVKLKDYTNAVGRIFAKWDSNQISYELSLDDWTTPNWNNLSMYVSGNGNTIGGRFQSTSFPSGQFVHVVGVYDASSQLISLYRNGTVITTTQHGTIPSSIYNSASNARVGGRQNGQANRFLRGIIDELRVSNVTRSADWIRTEYNNQSAPGSFYSVSPEQ